MRDDFEDKLNSWIAGCQKIVNDHFAKHYVDLTPNILSVMPGKKYVRIVSAHEDGIMGRSAWAFVDKETGDVLKAASWVQPAKNRARGNIFASDNGLTGMGPYGPPYLK